jgi:DNA-binding NtrC family response regulator
MSTHVPVFSVPANVSEEEVCKRYAQYVLDLCGGNRGVASRRLGISRPTLNIRLGMAPASKQAA